MERPIKPLHEHFFVFSDNPTVSQYIDNEPIDGLTVYPDKCTRKEIAQLQCYCDNKKHGCTWEGTVQDIEVGF